MVARFKNRAEGGRRLAAKLEHLGPMNPMVLALPRGGVPVGYEVARALGLPLDVFIVRKLGVPGHEELAMGAVASGGIRVLNSALIAELGIPKELVERVAEREMREIARRETRYRDGRPPADVHDHLAILVDDGLATGATMFAAVSAVRASGAKHIVVAVPISSPDTCSQMRQHADEVICAMTPEPLYAVGLWYEDFTQTTDEEVCALLAQTAGAADTAHTRRAAS
ncbi:phosphoribosyltransferase [Pendulispora brunnea]|uniref:Phosphoribosyltransferase n=1 Tax=Pendulispora brunnea TaxID=2905690 RepID=A0ABZ2KHE9_9BACT